MQQQRQPQNADGDVLWETRTPDPYVDLRQLGAGTYGVVSLAVAQADRARRLRGEAVPELAVKRFVVRNEADANREVRALRRAVADDGQCSTHVACYVAHYIGPAGRLTIVTQYVNGATMYETMRRAYSEGRHQLALRPANEFRRITRSLLEGLHYMHGRNVVHRDIKADNIMLLNYGTLSVSAVYLDLGLACTDRADCQKQELSILAHNSPEQLEAEISGGRTELSLPKFKSSDVWFLAITLHYFGFAGRRPYEAPTDREIRELRKALVAPSTRQSKAAMEKRLASLEEAVANDDNLLPRELLAEQRKIFSAVDDNPATTTFYNRLRADWPALDRVALRVLAEMFNLNWRARLLPLVGVMLIERADVTNVAPSADPFAGADMNRVPKKSLQMRPPPVMPNLGASPAVVVAE